MRCGFKIGGGIDQDYHKSPQGYTDNVSYLRRDYYICVFLLEKFPFSRYIWCIQNVIWFGVPFTSVFICIITFLF